jgi:hypothetical protein
MVSTQEEALYRGRGEISKIRHLYVVLITSIYEAASFIPALLGSI